MSGALIDLAREAEFTLGAALVRPSLRMFGADSVEPRVMQVLVALAKRDGEVVSRDDLIAGCWAGRAVSEDAINRALSKVRKLGEDSGAFTIETIARVGYRLMPASASAAAHGAPVLAVLAFDNLSPDPELAFFADGVSDEILQLVARSTPLKVIARASSFQFRSADKAISHVVSQLGATHVLDGSVRRGGGRVRIGVQLIDAQSQTTLWANQYDRPSRDLMAVQDEIAAMIASKLHVRFTPPPSERIDSAAHDIFLRAREANYQEPRTAGLLPLVDEAIAAAPRFAPAWALAASARMAMRRFEADEAQAAILYSQARERAERAYALDETSAEAITELEETEPVCGRWTARLARARACVAASSDRAAAGMTLAYRLTCAGRFQESLPLIREAYERNPLNPAAANRHANALQFIRQVGESLDVFEGICRRWPNAFTPWGNMLMCALQNGRWDILDRWYTPEHIARSSSAMMRDFAWGVELYRDPTPERAAMMLQHLERGLERNGRVRFNVLAEASAFCDLDAVYALVERADFSPLFTPGARLDVRDTSDFALAIFTPFAARLQGDPRFLTLCARLGVVAHWIETECWPDCARRVRYDFRAESRRLMTETSAA